MTPLLDTDPPKSKSKWWSLAAAVVGAAVIAGVVWAAEFGSPRCETVKVVDVETDRSVSFKTQTTESCKNRSLSDPTVVVLAVLGGLLLSPLIVLLLPEDGASVLGPGGYGVKREAKVHSEEIVENLSKVVKEEIRSYTAETRAAHQMPEVPIPKSKGNFIKNLFK